MLAAPYNSKAHLSLLHVRAVNLLAGAAAVLTLSSLGLHPTWPLALQPLWSDFLCWPHVVELSGNCSQHQLLGAAL